MSKFMEILICINLVLFALAILGTFVFVAYKQKKAVDAKNTQENKDDIKSIDANDGVTVTESAVEPENTEALKEMALAPDENKGIRYEEEIIVLPRAKVRLLESGEKDAEFPETKVEVTKKVETVTEVKKEEVVIEKAPETVVKTETTSTTEELVIGDLNSIKRAVNRIPFDEKMLKADKETKGYYDELYNKFSSYKKVHGRISAKCASFRVGRDLVAKITYHGKTMKLHLALDVKKFNEDKYHQKDYSEKRMYEEVPFTVKVKSDRGVKFAFELIDALAVEKQLEEKKDYVKVNSIKLLKEFNKQ